MFSDPNPFIDLLESEHFELLHWLAWYVNDTRFVVVGHDGPDDEMAYALDLNPPKEIV